MEHIIEPPIYADFLITGNCNFNCPFCSASANNRRTEKDFLTIDKVEDILNQMDDIGLLRVAFEGGEPFLRKDIIEILQIADKLCFDYYVNTNGSAINKKIAKRLSTTNIPQVCISIDGHISSLHDQCRGYPGAFEKMKMAVRLLQDQGIMTQAIITLSSINGRYLYDILHFIKSVGIKSTTIMLLASVGSADKKLVLPFHEWTELLVRLSLDKAEGNLPISLRIATTSESKFPWKIFLPLNYAGYPELIKLWMDSDLQEPFGKYSFGCTAGKTSLAIDNIGDVYGCSLMVSMKELVAGNMHNQSLKDIWFKSTLFNKFRTMEHSDVSGPCSTCTDLPICKGGCRACAQSLTGSILGSDLRCPEAKV